MSQGARYAFSVIRPIADALWHYLATSVVVHDIAGSVRRIVAQPRPHPSDTCGDIELVLDADPALIRAKLLARPGVVQHITGGQRLLKCEIVTRRQRVIPVQLHFATTLNTLESGTVNNYGYKLLLATGDADWNRLLMQPRRASGLLPAHLHFVEERFPSHGFPHVRHLPVHVPTEEAVFAAWGVPYVSPHRRNAVTPSPCANCAPSCNCKASGHKKSTETGKTSPYHALTVTSLALSDTVSAQIFYVAHQ